MDPRGPVVTVVVCSLNGAAKIGACLEAIAAQTIRERAQVVVVDDGSSDGTADVARRFEVDVVVHDVNRGISAARNSGIRAATAPVVAFTDDDCIPAHDWLERLVAPYERNDVVAVGGSIEVHRVEGLVNRYLAENNPLAPLELDLARFTTLGERFALYVSRMWGLTRQDGPRAVYSFPGANMSFRREALTQLGGFDERMTFGADDEYICRRARESFPGSQLWFAPDAIVRHDFEGTVRDLWRRNLAYGRGHARSFQLDAGRRWPMLFPAPVVTALAVALLARRRPRRALLAIAAVPLLLPQGIRGARHSRHLTDLAFSYLRLAEETALDVGMVSGLLRAVRHHRYGRD